MGPDNADKPGAAARARARRECAEISRALARRRDLHGGIHRARKAIRRLRSLLALAAGRFDEVGAIDRRLAQLCDGLSGVRDAQALRTTAGSLAAKADASAWTPLIAHLAARRDALADRLLATDPGLARRRTIAAQVAADLDAIDWERLRRKDLAAGWKRARTRLAKAAKRASEDPSPQNLHRYRRRLRRLRMQWDALQAIAADVTAPVDAKRIKALRRTSDRLGRLRDLQALRNAARRATDVPHRAELLSRLTDELKRAAPKPGWFD